MIYIVAQVLGLLAFIISLIAYHKDKKEKILGNMVISNILDLTHYLLLEAYSGCIAKTIAILRNYFIIIKNKNKILSSNLFLFIFITIYFIAGIITYNSFWALIPIISAVIYLICVWNGNEITVKRTAFFCYFLWLIYNIMVFSISGIISNIVSIVSIYIALHNEKSNKKFQ